MMMNLLSGHPHLTRIPTGVIKWQSAIYRMQRAICWSFAILALGYLTSGARAEITQRPGWVIMPSVHNYATLLERVVAAAKTKKLGVVARASASVGAKQALGKTIAGNTVFGFYHPRYAVPMLEASIAAGIEAPIRVYVTENDNGTATLSYKIPSHVFAPYMEDGGDKLADLASELDELFDQLAKDAVSGK